MLSVLEAGGVITAKVHGSKKAILNMGASRSTPEYKIALIMS